jgi:hypothetical protein
MLKNTTMATTTERQHNSCCSDCGLYSGSASDDDNNGCNIMPCSVLMEVITLVGIFFSY